MWVCRRNQIAIAMPSPSPKMSKPYFCNYAGAPTVIGETCAWSFVEGSWKEIRRSEAYIKAQLIGELEFRRLFGELPPLPDGCPIVKGE